METEAIVRKLDLKDIDQMVDMRIELQKHDKAYMEQKEILSTRSELVENTKEYLRSHLNKNLFMFGVFVDDLLVANCGVYIEEYFPCYPNPSGKIGYICNVYTRGEYRKRGYQKKALNMCLDYAKELKIIDFKLTTRNPKAVKLYKSLGFVKSKKTYALDLQPSKHYYKKYLKV